MTIPYILVPNTLTDEGGYLARVKSVGTAGQEMIAERIVARGSTVNRSDVLGVLHLLEQVCIDLVLDGWRVHLGQLLRLYCSIEGTFESAQDRFEPHRHKLKGVIRPGPELNKALAHRGKPRKKELNRPVPNPRTFTDLTTDAHDRLTPGGPGRLEGSNLKFDPQAADEGIFLIGSGRQAQRLKVFDNRPSSLIFQLPELSPGTYYLEVRARVGNARVIRTSRLNQALVVDNSPR